MRTSERDCSASPARMIALLSSEQAGPMLDSIGRKYDRFRTGVPLKGLGRERSA
jgi:hypothetical protein